MRVFFLFLLLLSLSQSGLAQSCDNNLMLNNADLETGTLSGWEILSGQVEITTDANNGNFAMAAHTTGDKSEFGYTTVYYPNPSKTCVLTVCGKIEGNPDNAGFGIIYGNLFLQPIRVDSIPITNTSYECFSLTVDPPAGTFGYAISGSINGGNGSMYLDDFCFECFDDCIVGDPCDDGDPNTSGDYINEFCECQGSACGVFPNAGDDVALILGQSTLLTATGGVSYSWSTGQMAPSITVQPTMTTTYQVTVSDGADCSEIDSVTVSVLNFYDVGNYVWVDENGDGCQDANEGGLNGVRIELYDTNNVRFTGKTTAPFNGEDGYYNFNILEGEYRFKIVLPSNYIISPKSNCGDDTIDSDFDPVTGFTDFFTVDGNLPNFDVGLILNQPLPVEISHFDVSHKAGKNELIWNVITEVDLESYIVERKLGSESFFEEITVVKAKDHKTYQTVDDDLLRSGTYYYRLIMKDNNGQINVSNIVSVEVEVEEQDFIHAYPNPATSDITIILNTKEDVETHEVSLFNATGQRIYYIKYASQSNYLKQTLDMGDLSNGIYTVHVKAGNTSFVKKIVKVDQ